MNTNNPPEYIACLTATQKQILKNHLFPGDGLEAGAILLCGQRNGGERRKLIVREIHPIPYDQCSIRSPVQLKWSTELLLPLIKKAIQSNLAIVKTHSHPNEFFNFSEIDDFADRDLFPSLHGWTDNNATHSSMVMLQDGSFIGRMVDSSGQFYPMKSIHIIGDNLEFQFKTNIDSIPEFGKRTFQTFGEKTYNVLKQLKIAVVGCSGTGSIVIEQLVRNNVGELVLVDPDVLEEKNLNRILNATLRNAKDKTPKVQLFASVIDNIGLGTKVKAIRQNLSHINTILEVADCDVVFGCMDTVEGRHILNRISTFYTIPYFDLGVKLLADGTGNVDEVCGTVHYICPGKSSLLSRKLYTLEQLRAETTYRLDPENYEELLKEGYIQGVNEEKPAVISVNMTVAAMAINEFLARIHCFRAQPNSEYAINRFSLVNGLQINEKEGRPCKILSKHLGKGDVMPLLDLPYLSEEAV